MQEDQLIEGNGPDRESALPEPLNDSFHDDALTRFSEGTIERVESDPTSDTVTADLLRLVNLQSDELAERALYKPHEPRLHSAGWSITIHNQEPSRACGLMASWLRDNFHLGYPLDVKLTDSEIISALDPEGTVSVDRWREGRPVALAENRVWAWNKAVGVAYTDYLPILIDHQPHDFCVTIGQTNLLYLTRNIEKPDIDLAEVYREAMLKLLALSAVRAGTISRVCVEYENVLIPEDLERQDFENVTWISGRPGQTYQHGEQIVQATRGQEQFVLRSGTPLCPWVTIRDVPVPPQARTPATLAALLEDLLFF